MVCAGNGKEWIGGGEISLGFSENSPPESALALAPRLIPVHCAEGLGNDEEYPDPYGPLWDKVVDARSTSGPETELEDVTTGRSGVKLPDAAVEDAPSEGRV